MERRDFVQKTLAAGLLSATATTAEAGMRLAKAIKTSPKPLDHYDVIVLGVGTMGSSACYHLAKTGHKVLGIEQFEIPHKMGSHSGQSRMIRKAYFEHPDYVPLLDKAYANWAKLEREVGTTLFEKTGLLYFGKPDHMLLSGVRESATKYNLDVQRLSSADQKKKYPQFRIPSGFETLWEPDAGFLSSDRAILAYTEQALQYGAHIRTNEKTTGWKIKDGHIEVTTNSRTYNCTKLIVAVGAWSEKMIPGLDRHLKVTKQTLAWVQPKSWEPFSLENFPCWTLADPNNNGIFYGFPMLSTAKFGGPIGLKLAHHAPGPEMDPDAVDRNIAKAEEEKIITMMQRYIPEGYAETLTLDSCLYTYSPDENFVLGLSPESDKVILAAGFSGHGFKFASVIGEVLADLAIHETTDQPIGFLSPLRFTT